MLSKSPSTKLFKIQSSGLSESIMMKKWFVLSDIWWRSIVFNDSGFTPLKFRYLKIKYKVSFSKCYYFKNESRTAFGINSLLAPQQIPRHTIQPKYKYFAMEYEGARVVTGEKQICKTLRWIHGFKGNFLNTFTPENLKNAVEKGPRNNGTLEGIDSKFKTIYSHTEEPLFEDGDQATTSKGGLIRLYQFDVKTKRT
jgi:hypothetical protein